MTSTVTLDGFPLTGTTGRGGRIRVTGGLDTTWYAKSLNRNRQSKSQQDGSWPSTGFVNALALTITGIAVYTDAASAKADARQMLTLCGNGSTAPLTVTDDLVAGTRLVELDSIVVSPVRGTMFSYTIMVTAPDPLVYGPTMQASANLASTAPGAGLQYPLAYPLDYGAAAGVTPGSLTLPNAGQATYWPTIRIDGPVTNPQISSDQGDWVRFNGTLASGQWLLIDCGRRRVLLNGSLQASQKSKITSSGRWLGVIPGGAMLSWTADTADPAALFTAYGFQGAWS
jgi:hypothetical protein